MKTEIKLTASEKNRKSQTFNMELKKGYSELFLCPKAQKNIFLHLTTKLSIYYLSYSIYTQDPLDIVTLSNMQDTCHMWTKP